MKIRFFKLNVILAVIVAASFLSGFVYEQKKVLFPGSASQNQTAPDHIVISPNEDMHRAMNINWRSSQAEGFVEYWATGQSGKARRLRAGLKTLGAPEMAEGGLHGYFSATLKGLKPGTAYSYRVGGPGHWSRPRSFTTAPDKAGEFSFVFFGDTQKKPKKFGKILSAIDRRHPEAAFYLLAGDLVDDAHLRESWDALLSRGEKVYGSKPIAAAPGNHEYKTPQGLRLYNSYLNLPGDDVPGRADSMNYAFAYGGASFIVLDSNRPIAAQNKWLEKELRRAKKSGRDFIIVMFHHPPYNTKPGRSNHEIRDNWTPLFDKYRVDLVLNGHDHSYMRTKPLRGGQPTEKNGGTSYVVATSSRKFYKIQNLEAAARQLPQTATYQLITIGRDQNGRAYLKYNALGLNNHELLDEFVISKAAPAAMMSGKK